MGANACWIQLRVSRAITPARISEEIEAYWRAKGARVLAHEHRPLEPYGLAQAKKLDYVIGVVEKGWVQIVDSERFTADYGRAKHLGASLDTAVRFVGGRDVSQAHLERWVPSSKKAPSRKPPPPSLAEADVADEPELALAATVLSRVRPDLYDAGPDPEAGGEKKRPKAKNYLDAHQKVAEKLDANAARALLDAGSDVEPCLTVFLGQAIDLNEAAARKFTLAIAASALSDTISPSGGSSASPRPPRARTTRRSWRRCARSSPHPRSSSSGPLFAARSDGQTRGDRVRRLMSPELRFGPRTRYTRAHGHTTHGEALSYDRRPRGGAHGSGLR